MMEQSHIQKIAEGAGRFARWCHRLGRPYVWRGGLKNLDSGISGFSA